MTIKTEWIGPTVLVCKKVLKTGTRQQIMDHVKKKGDSFWENTIKIDENTGEELEDNRIQEAKESKLLNKIYEAIDDSINECVEEYANKFQHYGSFITRKEDYIFMKIKKGTDQEEHVDIDPIEDDDEEEDTETIISPSSSRKINIMIFLNDDYEGGEIVFPYQKITYKPIKGDVLVFDCGALHPYSCNKITNGKKFVIHNWML